ncbi:MAG: hypothetical protein JKY37_19035, partial [Nannocystaceae bacterium]|nr:hypothetical protein [Nannocystaceae bacterium]
MRSLIVFLGMLLLTACPAKTDDEPSVVGKSPEDAAAVAVDEVCDYLAVCGEVHIACTDCIGEGCGDCTAERVDVDRDECVDVVEPDLRAGFECVSLTAKEEAEVDGCLAALAELGCVTVGAAEAWADGEGGPSPLDPPPECDLLAMLALGVLLAGGSGATTDATPSSA